MAHTQLTTRSKVSVGIAAVALVGLGAYGFAFLLQDQNPQLAQNTPQGGSTPATQALDQCLFKCGYAEGFCISDRYQTADSCAAARAQCEVPCREQYLIDSRLAVNTPPSQQGGVQAYVIQTNSVLPQATLNQAYQLQFSASNIPDGTQVVWAMDASTRLPVGLSLLPNGALSGAPQEAGTFTFRIRVSSQSGQSDPRDFVLTVADSGSSATNPNTIPSIALTVLTPTALPNGLVGQSYDFQLESTRPLGQYGTTWDILSGRLPNGVSMDDKGGILGTPTEAGTFNVRIRVKNGPNLSTDRTFVVVVNAPLVDTYQPVTPGFTIITDTALPKATVNQPYNFQLTASTLPFPKSGAIWTVSQDRLPRGLTLSNDGLLSGSSIEAGTFRFTARLVNAGSYSAEKVLILVVADAQVQVVVPPVVFQQATVAPVSLPIGVVGQPYQQQLRAIDTGAQIIWWLTPDTHLPAGLTMNDNGLISGTPTAAGQTTVIIDGGDSRTVEQQRVRVHKQYVLTIEAAQPGIARAATAPFPDGVVNQYYKHFPLAVSGGSLPYVWRVETDRLPNGVVIDQVTGVVSGTPTEAGTFKFTLRVNDAAGSSVTQSFTFRVGDVVAKPPVTNPVPDPNGKTTSVASPFSLITLNAFPSGMVGDSYSHRPMIVSGGREPYSWKVTSGQLPSGLAIDSSGAVVGTPTAAGIFTFTIQSREGDGAIVSTQFTVTINARQQYTQVYISDLQWPTRVNNINDMGMRVHDLIKLSDDGDPNTQYDTTVYYVGADGRRHAFPNPHVYFSWFSDYANVRIIGSRQLANIPLGANITYRPGIRLVKFLTDPRVYAVDTQRRLRWIASERAAYDLYGDAWNRNVDDISDAFYMDYRFDGAPVNMRYDFDPARARNAATYPSDVLP